MDCMFSGETPNNEEHIIPRWLQRKFSLHDLKLCIPNGTTLPYKFAKVPVKDEHNSEFGKIENNISNGRYDLNEIYLWALKIHIGMIYRDSSLKSDIRSPESPMIVDVGDYNSEVQFFRYLYRLWKSGGTTNPSPLGSVFLFDSLTPNHAFDFFHCFLTGTVCLNIGKKFIAVFLWDQTDGLKTDMESVWLNHHKSTIDRMANVDEKNSHAYMAHHIWACESAYWLSRYRRAFKFIKTKNSFNLISSMSHPEPHPENENDYKYICRSFNLDLLEFHGRSGNKYAQFNINDLLKTK